MSRNSEFGTAAGDGPQQESKSLEVSPEILTELLQMKCKEANGIKIV